MRRVVVVLLATLLAGCVSVKVVRGPSVGPAFVGSWKGTGSQSDREGEWSIALTLADGRPGTIVGTIHYPSLACGGDLILRSGESDAVELVERITFGECVDNGVLRLRSIEGGRLGFDWREGTLTARGTLSRAGS